MEDGGDTMGLKSLGGYFCNLDAAETNKKKILEKLVASNAKLATTKEELVDVVKKLTNKNTDLHIGSNQIKKRSGSGAIQGKRDSTMCPH